MLVNDLAQKSGINVATSKVQRFNNKHHTFLTKRFDRIAEGKRIHFSSAMTLLGYSDRADNSAGVSYLELVEFIVQNDANVKEYFALHIMLYINT